MHICGQVITHWRMLKAMELFFFLLDHERPIHKEKILSALWPESEEQALQTLRSAVYYLRKIKRLYQRMLEES